MAPPFGWRKIIFDGLKKIKKTGGRADGPPFQTLRDDGGGIGVGE
jgi:hypothetical protein